MDDKTKASEIVDEQYKYGFKNKDVSILSTGKGLNEDIVKEISSLKHEPEWMKEFRLKSYRAFKAMKMPSFGPDLSFLDFEQGYLPFELPTGQKTHPFPFYSSAF